MSAERREGLSAPLLQTLAGRRLAKPPIWLMRQAGRYLAEYREIRARAPSFLDFCYSPALAAEATLQPIRRFGFDAAILFSDILVAPDALGQTVSFEEGEGPRLKPLGTASDLAALRETIDLGRLAPVFETVQRVRSALPSEVALIGFCGAPWTVATYMIAGRGTPDQAPARTFAYRHPELFQALIDKLVAGSADYLLEQIRVGAQAVQIFDSWAGVLPAAEFRRWCVDPVAAIAARVKAESPQTPIIAFPRGAGSNLAQFARVAGIGALGLDTSEDPRVAGRLVPDTPALQGNLDPLALLAGGRALDEAIEATLAAFGSRPHIFNLGHGILQQTPIEHVERLMKRVREA
jgi:uroporphyrinogen decarboxylase